MNKIIHQSPPSKVWRSSIYVTGRKTHLCCKTIIHWSSPSCVTWPSLIFTQVRCMIVAQCPVFHTDAIPVGTSWCSLTSQWCGNINLSVECGNLCSVEISMVWKSPLGEQLFPLQRCMIISSRDPQWGSSPNAKLPVEPADALWPFRNQHSLLADCRLLDAVSWMQGFFFDIDDILTQYLSLCILLVVLLQFILRLPMIPKLWKR